MYYRALPRSTMYYHIVPSTTMHYHVLPCTTIHYHALPCTTMHFHALQTCQPWPGKNLGNLKLPVAKTWRLVSRTWRSRPTMSSIIVLCICNIHYQARSQSFVKGGSKIKGGAKRRRKLLLIDIHEGIRIRIWMWSMITS